MDFAGKELDVLCSIARRAGQAIMEVYAGDVAAWEKEDASPLTEADLRADEIIRVGLERAFPGVFILSEESRSSGDGASDTLFLVDPLDGTKEFLKRNGEFTVNIALHSPDGLQAGVVYAPALDEMFLGAVRFGASKRVGGREEAIRVASRGAEAPLRVIGSRSHGGDALAAWLALLPQHAFVAAGSSLKFCRIAEGMADLYPRFGPTSQWDTAAAQCVLECAGGRIVSAQGGTLCYGLSAPILNPHFLAIGDETLLPALPPMASES